MNCKSLGWMAVFLWWGSGVVAMAAPARALYFTENQSILRAAPDGTGAVVLFENAIDSGQFFEALKIDSPNGHLYWASVSGQIYRGDLGGTGAVELHSAGQLKDFVVAEDSDTIFTVVTRRGSTSSRSRQGS